MIWTLRQLKNCPEHIISTFLSHTPGFFCAEFQPTALNQNAGKSSFFTFRSSFFISNQVFWLENWVLFKKWGFFTSWKIQFYQNPQKSPIKSHYVKYWLYIDKYWSTWLKSAKNWVFQDLKSSFWWVFLAFRDIGFFWLLGKSIFFQNAQKTLYSPVKMWFY